MTFINWIQVIGYLFLIYFSKAKNKTGNVLLRTGQNIRIRLDNTFDLGSIIEIFQRHVYIADAFKIPNNAKIIDLGASTGDFSLFCTKKFRECVCFCFEPNPLAFEFLKENILLNHLSDRIRAYSFAVSGRLQEIRVGAHAYPSINLLEVLRLTEIEICDLLKIDIEGAEYDLLLNSPAEILRHIAAITMECHIYDNNASSLNNHKIKIDKVKFEKLNHVKGHLSKLGFHVMTTPITFHNVCYLYAYR
jgi:FkbM family methyltransferase